jgi:YesN/AraC family two-component response regulator
MVKVVIADDEEFVRYFLKSVMDSLSYKVVAEVERGNDVYSVIKNTNPDILLLDINMPNLTGLEFLKYYSKDFPKTCIIILTSASSFQIAEEASERGADCFIRKDMPIEKMVLSIQKTWSTFSMERR